jgi:hypothetical protein
LAQIGLEGCPNLVLEREEKHRAGLPLGNLDPALAPVDVIESKGDDLAAAEAVRGDEQQHRVVSNSLASAPIDRLQ